MTSKSTTKQDTKSDQTTTQGVDPRIDPYWMNLLADTDKARASVSRDPLSGRAIAGNNMYDTLAGINANQTKGITDMSTMLASLQGQVTPGVFTHNALDAASGRLLDPTTNPYLEGSINAAINPITDRLTREVIPGIDTAAIAQNAFGGDRTNLARGQAGADWARAAGDIRANALQNNYVREQQRMDNAPAMFAQALGAETAIPQATLNLGDYERGLNQNEADRVRTMDQRDIDNETMTRMINEQLAFAGLAPAAQIYGAAPYNTQTSHGTTSGTTVQQQKQDPLMVAAQGAIGLGSMMAGLGWNPFAGKTAPPVNSYAPQYLPTPQIMRLPTTMPSPVQY